MAQKKQHLIITTYGTDGAAAAAMVLQKYPEADIERTSSNVVGSSLLAIADEREPGIIHICGVGPNEAAVTVLESLRKLKRGRFSVIWYCGRGYMNSWQERMEPLCKTAFHDCGSNVGAVQIELDIKKSERVRTLITIGEEYADSKRRRNKDYLIWHDLVQKSTNKYFIHMDDRDFFDAVYKLAGSIHLTESDQKQVAEFKKTQQEARLLGKSKAIDGVRKTIRRLASLDEPVLILGQTGTGKELAANAIHMQSRRSERPFLPVNCAVFSAGTGLAQDNLFGHARGAFTGADRNRSGTFEAADEGTLFFDELAELPLDVQVQLLRVLETGRFSPIGTTDTRQVNVRVIAATNRDLTTMVKSGEFRQDLYYRLNVLRMKMPALSERAADMKHIAQPTIQDLEKGGHHLPITDSEWMTLSRYDWPGNVRQFLNLIKRAALMEMTVTDVLAEEIADAGKPVMSIVGASKLFMPATPEEAQPFPDIRSAYMSHVLKLCDNRLNRAAKILAVSVNTLKRYTQNTS